MQRITLKLMMLVLGASLLLGYASLLFPHRTSSLPVFVGLVWLLVGVAAFLYLATRFLRFHKALKQFVRLLLAGNYDAALRVSCRRDEICAIESDLNKLAEHLREYDRLRAERVRQTQITLDLILDRVSEPILCFDIRRQSLTWNRAMRELFDVSQQSASLSAVEKIGVNREFVDLLKAAAETDKTQREGNARLQLPSYESSRDLRLKLVPVKDKDDLVSLVIILAEPCSLGTATD